MGCDVMGGRKVRGTAAEWENWMKGEGTGQKRKAGGRGCFFSFLCH